MRHLLIALMPNTSKDINLTGFLYRQFKVVDDKENHRRMSAKISAKF